MKCYYGCGQEAIHQFKNGKWCCCDNHRKCPSIRKKNSDGNKGPNNGMYNRIQTDETRNKIRQKKLGHTPWNKGLKNCHSEDTLLIISKKGKGKIPWNKGKTGVYSYASLEKMSEGQKKYYSNNPEICKQISISLKLSIRDIKNKYPLFSKIEEMRYNPYKPGEKEIQVHCKYHKCPNSKEKGGWFTPTGNQFDGRRRALEDPNGNEASYFYCCDKCKEECSLFNKTVSQLIKEDQIKAGLIEDPWYNSSEYQIWREQVFKLDNRICQYCGNEGNIAHHILPQKTHPELSLDPENGITVCEECHYKYAHSDQLCTTGHLSRLVCQRIIKIKTKL